MKFRRTELAKNGLGFRSLAEDVSAALPKGIELYWNIASEKWAVYRVTEKGGSPSDDILTWQLDLPARELTPRIVRNLLQKYDSTEGGRWDVEDLQKKWMCTFKDILEQEERKHSKFNQELEYIYQDNARYIERVLDGAKQCVVPAGPAVGATPDGVPIRPYKRVKNVGPTKQIITG